ncbi:ketopantoate reductase family protein [Paenibacillus sp. L3-i20]|uniref:ketopantoate reductase family protein n=1 Tax=Paenibacillus sp. L3-i20 TaxID=2905833 RepID=UPI001EE01382|nr:2-dehydropantoate 2-reductase N-terminal domain-containing protein [Paenibacillus sp. L3-i20]GKU77885.1 ketopantoate reductase [Paenibacillus sp. L3-i20]
MNILVFGAGVIGSVYGYVLSRGGHHVVHYVRSERLNELQDGIKLNLLDGRNKKRPQEIQDNYKAEMVDELPDLNTFDLVLISVRHYQVEAVLQLLAGKLGKADILVLNHSWQDISEVSKAIPKEKCLWGFPGAGGGFDLNHNHVLNGVLMNNVNLGEWNGEVTSRLKNVAQMFQNIGVKPVLQSNIGHWLQKHFAINAGISSSIMQSGSAEKFMSSVGDISQGVLAVREGFEVCKSRGVDIKSFSDAKAFYLPVWLVAFSFRMMLKTDKVQRRIFELYNGTEEIKRIYQDIRATAEQHQIRIPVLQSMKPSIDRL